MKPIYQKLYQFTTYIPPMDFTIHQYLLAARPSILFAAGTADEAKKNIPAIREILGKRPLSYIFISHMESDECGGLNTYLEAWPEARVICSCLTARELPGYGIDCALFPVNEEKRLNDGELSLRFFNYPAEVHLQDGVLCYEENTGIFYSSDLMLRYGNAGGKHMENKWENEIAAIDSERVPNKEKLMLLQKNLSMISPSFVAVGHGFCVKCEENV